METPPRAWGREFQRALPVSTGGNTPTGVGKRKTSLLPQFSHGKHPHGRGEEFVQRGRRKVREETPPRAWGRVPHIQTVAVIAGNTPTCVGKRAHSNFKQFEYYSIFFPFVKEPGSVCADFSIISCSPDMDVKSFVGMPFA